MQDQFCNAITCSSHAALAAYDRALDAQLHAQRDVIALTRAAGRIPAVA